MSDTLTIEVLAGLANRIRAMISAICLAEELGKNLHVIWSANDPACMARFDMLFDTSSLPRWVRVDMGPREEEGVMILTPEEMEAYIASKSTQTIRSYAHFYQKNEKQWLKYLRALRPLQPIPEIPEGAIGIHVRRGDHEKAKKFSPIHAFIERMKKEPEATIFVVATDSKNERRALLEAFDSTRLIFPANTLSRMTLKGIQDAVLDFICLSRTTKIIGSYCSSFSELASMYGNISLEIVKED